MMMKRLLAAVVSFALAVTPVYAQEGRAIGPNPTATGQAATGQIPGTATNDNATAGNVGEYRSASGADTGQGTASATVTITIASPGVVTWGTTIPFVCNGPPGVVAGGAVLNFTTTGALPTGIVAGTNYYVICSSISGNTFQIATTADNAIAGTAINTSGTQSGVQTGVPTGILANGVYINAAAMSLAAGDWDVSSDLSFLTAAATSVTSFFIGTGTVSASLSVLPGRFVSFNVAAEVPGVANTMMHVGPARYSLSATTTIYCYGSGSFTISTAALWGGCRARRVR